MVAVGIIIGGAPGYTLLAIESHNALTIPQVDDEVVKQNKGIEQKLDDLKDEVNKLTGQVEELNRSNR